MNTYFAEEPIQLITQNDGVITFNEQAAAILSRIPQQLGVVTVTGGTKTGKSYFLNRVLLNRQSGFRIGSTVNSMTKGLWMWSQTLKGTSQDGSPISYLLIDSEGFVENDHRLACISYQIASILLYNTISIDDQTLDQLALMSSYMKPSEEAPSLFWIIRDFSLQLVDPDGKSITTKEYLERAFLNYKGQRRLSQVFRQRDCVSLVRPLLREDNLQMLDKLDLEQLRPEFVEQIIQVRRKITSSIKLKTYKNQPLTGPLMIQLVKDLVNQFNTASGTISIMNGSISPLDEAFNNYEKIIRELERKLPVQLEEIKQCHKQAKQSASEIFKKRSNDLIQLKELFKKCKAKIQALQQQNELQSEKVCNQFINREFISIQRRIQNNEYRSILEFERDIKLFYQFLLEHGPKTVLRQQVYQDFYTKQMNDDLSQVKSSTDEKLRQWELKAKEIKEDKERELKDLQDRLVQCERERADDQNRIRKLNEQLKEMKEERMRNDREMKKLQEQERKASQKLIDEYRSKAGEMEHQLKQTERQLFLKESEFNKQKALVDQRMNQLQRQLDEYQKKEQYLDSSMVSTKSEYSNQLKDVSCRYEAMLQNLQDKVKEQNDKIQGLQDQLISSEQKYDMLQSKFNTKEQSLVLQLSDQLSTIQRLKAELGDKNQNEIILQEEMKQRYEMELQEMSGIMSSLECQVKEKQEKYISLRQNLEKEMALLQQQNQFLEVQNDDLRVQLSNMKRNHEQTINLLECSAQDQQKNQSISRQMVEIKEAHLGEMKQLEFECEQQKKSLMIQIDQLQHQVNESELKLAQQQSEYGKEIMSLKNKMILLEEQKAKLTRECNNFEALKNRLSKEFEERLLQRSKANENEIEELKHRNQLEMRDIQRKHEEQLMQLRNFCEIEKERLERRFQEEKDNLDRLHQQTLEEYDMKQKEEIGQYEDDLQQLREEIMSQEQSIISMNSQFQKEVELKDKQIQSLEGLNKELKMSINQQHLNRVSQYEQQLQHYQNEKYLTDEQNIYFISILVTKKLDDLQDELQKKEQDLMQCNQKRIQLEDMYISKENSLETKRMEWNNERNNLLSRIEEQKRKNEELQDEYLQTKIMLEKNIALSTQQNDFLNSKLQDLQDSYDASQNKFEQMMKSSLRDQSEDNQRRISRLTEEVSEWQARYDRLKSQLKEAEVASLRVISDLEKENAILQERLLNSELKFSDLDQRYQSELANLQSQVTISRESQVFDKKPLQSEVEKLKGMLMQLDNQYSELSANYDRDTVLWQGKLRFLEEQRDQAKQDLQEAMTKFEQTIITLQKSKYMDREDEENSITDMLTTMEKKYQVQLADLQETYQHKVRDYEDKLRGLEREMKSQQDRSLVEYQGKLGNQLSTERKLQEMNDIQQRLQEEIDLLKSERDAKNQDLIRVIDSEKLIWKAKLSEFEERLKDAEKKRASMIFDHEKERARWNLEKDHLLQQKNELSDNLVRLEKKKEALVRENEKLKNDSKYQKRINHLSNPFSTNRRSPSKSPLGSNRMLYSFDAGNSFELVKSQLQYNDDAPESFEAYYQQMQQQKQIG